MTYEKAMELLVGDMRHCVLRARELITRGTHPKFLEPIHDDFNVSYQAAKGLNPNFEFIVKIPKRKQIGRWMN